MNDNMIVRGISFKLTGNEFNQVKTERMIDVKEYNRLDMNFHNSISHRLGQPPLPEIGLVKECACQATGISIEQFDSRSRKREAVIARQMAMTYYVSNDISLTFSLEKIGKSFGGKNHATVCHAGKSISNLIETKNQEVVSYVSRFIKNISDRNSIYPISMTPIDRKIKRASKNTNKP